MSDAPSLYERLGGYDAIAAVADNLLPRLTGDELLKRFWDHRGDDGVAREKQLLVDFLCNASGGPLMYTGRDMVTTHKGMRINEADWTNFLGHLNATFDALDLPDAERNDVLGFIGTLKEEIVEA